jgi:iron complex transport system substrate-binding protein
MNTLKSLVIVGLILLIVVVPIAAQDANLVADCVTDYDASVDYFPDKVTVDEAANFSVEYFSNYKVVTVNDAFEGAGDFSYALVQCGTPAPDASELPEGTQVVEVPVQRMIAMSTTQLPHLTELGLLYRLIGLDSLLFASNPEVRELIDAGELIEIGSGATVNIELVLDAEPDMVMTFGFNPDTDAHPVLTDAGVFTALNAEWREDTPLARAEWIKYTALFFNAEDEAEAAFDDIVSAYDEARELAATVPAEERPVVLWNSISIFSDSWAIPGSATFAGALIEDAGGVIAMGDEVENGNLGFFGFESVYDSALESDIWMPGLFGVTTIDDVLALDPRFADFTAVQNGQVWNNDLAVNENGGNDYFELGVTNPDLILQDLVAIFHPDLLPDHDLLFFRPLE